jgi:hypothetical protein
MTLSNTILLLMQGPLECRLSTFPVHWHLQMTSFCKDLEMPSAPCSYSRAPSSSPWVYRSHRPSAPLTPTSRRTLRCTVASSMRLPGSLWLVPQTDRLPSWRPMHGNVRPRHERITPALLGSSPPGWRVGGCWRGGHRHGGLSFAECGRYPGKGDRRAPRAHPADAPTPKWGLGLRHTNHLEGPQRNSQLPP